VARETLLDARIHEVIRVLPTEQAQEIRRQDSALYDGALHIEFGVLCQPMRRSYEDPKPHYLRDYIPQLTTWLAWEDLALAEQHDFPALSPKRAMYLGRTATAAAETIQAVAPTIETGQFMALASGIVGLHGAIIGSEEVLKTNEDAQIKLSQAVEALRDNFVRPLYTGRSKRY
jgi:hypothetical protein